MLKMLKFKLRWHCDVMRVYLYPTNAIQHKRALSALNGHDFFSPLVFSSEESEEIGGSSPGLVFPLIGR